MILLFSVWLFGCIVHALVAFGLRAERDPLAWAFVLLWPLATPCLVVSQLVTRLMQRRTAPPLTASHGYRDHARCPTCGQRVLGDTPERLPEREPALFETVVRVAETMTSLSDPARRK